MGMYASTRAELLSVFACVAKAAATAKTIAIAGMIVFKRFFLIIINLKIKTHAFVQLQQQGDRPWTLMRSIRIFLSDTLGCLPELCRFFCLILHYCKCIVLGICPYGIKRRPLQFIGDQGLVKDPDEISLGDQEILKGFALYMVHIKT